MEDRSVETQAKIRDVLLSLSHDERKLLSGVINAEREHLRVQTLQGINDDLWKVITETIK